MVNQKQLERLVAKVRRIANVYEAFLIRSRTEVAVTVQTENGGRPVRAGEPWGSAFGYARFSFRMPPISEEPVWLECDNGGVESLVEINGMPYGMFDTVENAEEPMFRVHRYLRLEGVKEGAEISVEAYASHTIAGTQPYGKPHTFALRTLEGARIYRGTWLVTFREDLRELIDRLKLFHELFDCTPADDWLKQEQYRVYEELFRVLPMEERAPERAETERAKEALERFFRALPAKRESPKIGIVGHSHLDTAWLWTVEETRRKATRTAANAVTLLNRYPEYRFIMSSVLYLDWFRRDNPAFFRKIAALVKEGRFEPNGAAWVECDCNLPCGEALVRQFVKGKLFLREQFGYEADVFWLPDTFGYSAALPQIMKKCGVNYFCTTKLSWNDTNEFPYDSFIWQGIDGSCVTAHFNTIQSDAGPAALAARMKAAKQKHLNDGMLIAYGYGDGGGGPSDEMVSRAIQSEKLFYQADVRHTSVSDFMKSLWEKPLPKYCGELYLELHRGTLTVQHELKKSNRELEIALRDAEYLAVATGRKAWKTVTDECWETLLLNQFHDIVTGTSIGEVNALAAEQNRGAISRLRGLCRGEGRKTAYYNTLCFPREETLEAPADEEGEEYPDFDGKLRRVARYRFAAYGKGKRIKAEEGLISFDGGVITTPYLRAEWKKGGLASLVYGGREYCAGLLNEIRVCECVPYQWDNWDIDADYPLKEQVIEPVSSVTVGNGACGLRLRSFYRFGEGNELAVDAVFHAFEPRVDFECRLDLYDKHCLVRAYFPTNLLASAVKNSVQFGFVEHSVYRNTSRTQAQFEVCNHKWSDLSETDYGISLLNDCKYGCACEEGTLSLTLAKTGTHPDPSGGTGRMYFKYALVFHRGGFGAVQTVQPAERFNIPPVATVFKPRSPLVFVSSPAIVCETVKFAERGEGIVLRLYECTGTYTEAELVFSDGFRIFECNLLEDAEKELPAGERLRLSFRPFEIKTILLKKD